MESMKKDVVAMEKEWLGNNVDSQYRGYTKSGTPILHGSDSRVQRIGKLMAELLEELYQMDQVSIVATDILFMLLKDALWIRDNYFGANNPHISYNMKLLRIATAKASLTDPKKFDELTDRYVSVADYISKKKD